MVLRGINTTGVTLDAGSALGKVRGDRAVNDPFNPPVISPRQEIVERVPKGGVSRQNTKVRCCKYLCNCVQVSLSRHMRRSCPTRCLLR